MMTYSGSPVILFCTWLSRIAWLNICWLVFSLAGLGIFGIMPASSVCLHMIRRYMNGANSISLLDFYREWRHEFLRVNVCTLPLVFIMAVMMFGFVSMNYLGNDGLSMLSIALIPLFIAALTCLVAVVIEISIWSCSLRQLFINAVRLIKQAPLIIAGTLFMLTVSLLLCLLQPICAVFFIFAPVAFVCMLMYAEYQPVAFNEYLNNV